MSQRGSIVRPNGKRRTWAILYRDPNRRQQWEGKFKTKIAAQSRLNEVLAEIDKGTYARLSTVLFECFAQEIGLWFAHQQATNPTARVNIGLGATVRAH